VIDIPQFNPLPGEWYYGAQCPTCRARVVMFMDPDDGEGPSQVPAGWIVATCPNGHEHRYRGSELKRYPYRTDQQ
jgi:hypothetical protein